MKSNINLPAASGCTNTAEKKFVFFPGTSEKNFAALFSWHFEKTVPPFFSWHFSKKLCHLFFPGTSDRNFPPFFSWHF
jgi:hypothetical protein